MTGFVGTISTNDVRPSNSASAVAKLRYKAAKPSLKIKRRAPWPRFVSQLMVSVASGAMSCVPSMNSGRTDIDVVGINDLGPVETNAHLLRYDSVHGRFPHEVKVEGDHQHRH